MNRLKNTLNQLESRLQSFIEGKTARQYMPEQNSTSIVSHIIAEMKAGIQPMEDERFIAPNLYAINVHPNSERALQEDKALLDRLVIEIQNAGTKEGFRFFSPPIIKILADPKVPTGEMRITVSTIPETIPETSTFLMNAEDAREAPSNAFLIVGSNQVFPIVPAVVNIGRRVDNHLVIEDKRVSRIHAQIRCVKGRMVIFDLGSRGGTFVNGDRITQCTLYPGDVISLAGFPLVFGQEADHLSDNSHDGTHPFVVHPSEK